MDERHYRIVRSDWGIVYCEDVHPARDGDGAPLEVPHQKLHSPTGMEFGYEGSGPADLARSILYYHTGNIPPPQLYQAFKRDHIASLDGAENTHTITWMEVAEWLRHNT